MVRRLIVFLVASGVVLLTASIAPAACVVMPEITFASPVGSIKHIGTCKHGPPPCDTFKVTAPFEITNDVDLNDDLSNQEIALTFGNRQTCDATDPQLVMEIHVAPGSMVVTTTGSHVKYSFKGMAEAFDFSDMSVLSVPLNLSITVNSHGKGVLKASGTGDFAAITSSPVVFALIPFLEPDSDNSPGINEGDFNCAVMSVKLRSSK
jgi:hypothetical protein